MGILSNLFPSNQSESYGDSCVQIYFSLYEKSVRKNPYLPPAVHLGEMWLGHFGKNPQANQKLLDPGAVKALLVTHGCLPHPKGGIAVALYILSIKHPQIVSRFPKFEAKYAELIGEIMALDQAKNWDELNKRFNSVNPGLQLQSPFPIVSEECREFAKELGLLKSE
jgi:hypothetical protein